MSQIPVVDSMYVLSVSVIVFRDPIMPNSLDPFSAATKSSSIEGLQNWNPFADDADSISDDVLFGKEFDRLRCGSESSIRNVKSREDLVMIENHGVDADPFSAAPFYHKSKGQHLAAL